MFLSSFHGQREAWSYFANDVLLNTGGVGYSLWFDAYATMRYLSLASFGL